MPGSEGGGVTRRGFLRSVGMTAGAGTMFATMGALDLAMTSDVPRVPFEAPRRADFSLTGRAAGSVVILGAGVAGLAAAYHLGKAGYQCAVLEARDRVGGRNYTVRAGDEHTDLDGKHQRVAFCAGQYLNTGPARIAPWMVTMDYCRELGVPLEVFNNVSEEAYIYREGDGMVPGHPMKRRAARADVYGYVSELLAKSTDQGALDKLLDAQDKERLLDLLCDLGDLGERSGDPAASHAYLDSDRRGYTVWPGAIGNKGVQAGPQPTVRTTIASGVGENLTFNLNFRHDYVMFQPVGGMDAIPTALAGEVGASRIQLGSVVTGLVNGPDQVQVTYRDATGREKSLESDYCIATLPPNLMARLPHNLGADVQRGLTAFRPKSVGKIGLEYRSRWWESQDRIYGGISETDLDIDHIWYPSHGYHTDRGVVVGYYNTDEHADVYTPLSIAQREARAIAQGAKIHGPKYRTELLSSFSIAWTKVPFVEGGWQDIPGDPEDPIYAPLATPTGRVYFAGDWLSHMVSWQHGAFESARKAVMLLHQRVLSGPADRR